VTLLIAVEYFVSLPLGAERGLRAISPDGQAAATQDLDLFVAQVDRAVYPDADRQAAERPKLASRG
jgi:hypothetical protein